ncbi:unnamed protein product [Notodromas monacha]|uniref:Uncharacterized protein n=1 Tax=Notodromas monacha TaxID=399045 RepID=A0A7R9BJM8_9CRUS|nr:unnamed protein product [Notodromas monacha]CAG0915888.1 unnamed protein product [Notodromas monacha]
MSDASEPHDEDLLARLGACARTEPGRPVQADGATAAGIWDLLDPSFPKMVQFAGVLTELCKEFGEISGDIMDDKERDKIKKDGETFDALKKEFERVTTALDSCLNLTKEDEKVKEKKKKTKKSVVVSSKKSKPVNKKVSRKSPAKPASQKPLSLPTMQEFNAWGLNARPLFESVSSMNPLDFSQHDYIGDILGKLDPSNLDIPNWETRLVEKCKTYLNQQEPKPEVSIMNFCLYSTDGESTWPLISQRALDSDTEYFMAVTGTIQSDFEGDEGWTLETVCHSLVDFARANPGKLHAEALLHLFREERHLLKCIEQLEGHLAPLGMKNRFGLTPIMVVVRRNFSERVLEALLKQAEGMRAVLDAADPRGYTAAHYCAAENSPQHLQVLVRYGANLTLQDGSNKTPLYVAMARNNEACISALREAQGIEYYPEMNRIGSVFSGLPDIYEPSQPQSHLATTGSKLVGYIRRELPGLLGMNPSLVVVPPRDNWFPAVCPYPDQGRKLGWEAEQNVFGKLHYALQLLHAFSVLLMEVKNITRTRDIARKGAKSETRGEHALNQMETHLKALGEHLQIDPSSWVTGCLALPDFPVKGSPASLTEAEIVFTEAASKYEGRNVMLCRDVLEDTLALKEWLSGHLSPCSSERREEFHRILCWALMLCMGVAVNAVDFHMSAPNGIVALLTCKQKSVLTHHSKNALLVLGGSGTGKTFLGVQKLKSLRDTGVISKHKLAYFVVARKNVGLCMDLRHQLEGITGAEMYPVGDGWQDADIESLERILDELLNECREGRVSCVIFDQLEDYPGFFSSELFRRMMSIDDFDLLWLLANPYDLPEQDRNPLMTYLEHQQGIVLDKRIRNTKILSSAIEHLESSLPLQVTFIPEPVGHPGNPLLFEFVENDLEVADRIARIIEALVQNMQIEPEDIVVVVDGFSDGILVNLDAYLVQRFQVTSKTGASMAPILVQCPVVGPRFHLTPEQLDKAYVQFLDFKENLKTKFKDFKSNLKHVSSKEDLVSQKVSGLLLRAMTKSLVDSDLSDVTVQDLFRNLFDSVTNKTQLSHKLVHTHRYLSVLERKAVRGFEAKVIVAHVDFSDYPSNGKSDAAPDVVVSRAKVMGVLVVDEVDKDRIEAMWHTKVHRLDLLAMALKAACILASFVIIPTLALECYVCKNQLQNSGVCDAQAISCLPEQDTCLTKLHSEQISRAIESPGLRFYVSKSCSNSTVCNEEAASTRKLCSQLWYKNVDCVSCCSHDRCNRDIDFNMFVEKA